MKIALVGSRGLNIDIPEYYIPACVTEIVSGGAKGVDTCAKEFARQSKLEFLPEYEKYGRAAPIKRNDTIIDYADLVVALWDGKSRGTKYVIDRCNKIKKPLLLFELYNAEDIGFAEIKSREILNLDSISSLNLKKLLLAELSRELFLEIDTELIEGAISAILLQKQLADERFFQAFYKKRIKESE